MTDRIRSPRERLAGALDFAAAMLRTKDVDLSLDLAIVKRHLAREQWDQAHDLLAELAGQLGEGADYLGDLLAAVQASPKKSRRTSKRAPHMNGKDEHARV